MKVEEVTWCQIQEWYPKFKIQGPSSFLPLCLGRIPFPIESDLNFLVSKLKTTTHGTKKKKKMIMVMIVLFMIFVMPSILVRTNWMISLQSSTLPCGRPEMEFRCFVRGQSLVGISQRDVTVFYPALLEEKKKIGAIISRFFEDNLAGKFGSANYVFDVYVTKDGRVKVLDFNPWGAFTLPLLFSWDELGGNSGRQKIISDNTFEFRIIESKCGVRPGLKTAVPYDYIDTSAGSGWDEFLRRADDETTKQ
ncbi:Cell division cycle protein [Nymphaea thermarum]|nr:Cell division cycle protein [Nymphaea thermarum]